MLNLIENEGVEEDGYMRDDFARRREEDADERFPVVRIVPGSTI